QHVGGRLQQRGLNAGEQRRDRLVMRHQSPVAVNRECRVRLVSRKHQINGPARGGERGVFEWALGEGRRVPGGEQQGVALTQWHVELLGQTQYHLAARLRAACFEKAQVPRRNLGLTRQVELAQSPPLAPLAQKIAHRLSLNRFHQDSNDSISRKWPPLPLM